MNHFFLMTLELRLKPINLKKEYISNPNSKDKLDSPPVHMYFVRPDYGYRNLSRNMIFDGRPSYLNENQLLALLCVNNSKGIHSMYHYKKENEFTAFRGSISQSTVAS